MKSSLLATPSHVIEKVNRIIYYFLWNGKDEVSLSETAAAALGSLLLTNSNIDDCYQKLASINVNTLILLLVNYSLILHTEAMIIMSE